MIEFVPVVVLGLLASKLTSTLKFLLGGEPKRALTQLVAWAAGVAVTALFAASDFAGSIAVGGATLKGLGFASVVLVGLAVGSVGSTVYDVRAAVDSSDSADEPAMFGPDTPKA